MNQEPRSKTRVAFQVLTVALLTVLLFTGGAAIGIILLTRWQSYGVAAPAGNPPAGTLDERQRTIAEQLERYKAQLDSYKTQTDDLQRLTTLLVGLSSFYALVLGATSYLTAHQFMDRIRGDAERAERNVQALEKNFPVFTNFAGNIDNGIRELLQDFPTDEERDVYYARLTDADRERILFWERSMAFLNYFDLEDKTAKIYHGLGMFYSGRHSAGAIELDDIEREGKTPPGEPWLRDKKRSNREDCVRACFYLQKAVSGDPRNFRARNDFGLALSDRAGFEEDAAKRAEFLLLAEDSFRESSRIEPAQQRALYNLARSFSARKDYESAIHRLTDALSHENWQTKPNKLRTKDIHYNRACYRCLLAQRKQAEGGHTTHDGNALREIKEDFEQWRNGGYNAAPVVLKEMLRTLEADVKPDGDLAWLYATEPHVVNETLTRLRLALRQT